MKWILLLLLLVSFTNAGGLWVDHYMDCMHDTESFQSVPNTYYGNTKIGASFKYGDVFLSHYQYGMYGDRSITTNFGLGIKKAWEVKKVFMEAFILGQRDFDLEFNSVWAGFYVKANLFEWGK